MKKRNLRKARIKQLANKALGFVSPADHQDRARLADASHWAGDLDFSLFDQDGLILKASEGATFKDSRFQDNVIQFVSSSLWEEKILGAYHFWREQYWAEEQAQNLWNAIQKVADILKIDPSVLMDIVVLDVEGGKHSNNPGFTNAWKVGNQKRWADHVIDTMEYIKGFAGKSPWLYINNNDYTANLASDKRLLNYKLWIAWPVPSAKNPISPAPWTLWQNDWSGSVPWSNASIDLNVYYSDVDQLHEDLRGTEPPHPPDVDPPPDNCDEEFNQALELGKQALEDLKRD